MCRSFRPHPAGGYPNDSGLQGWWRTADRGETGQCIIGEGTGGPRYFEAMDMLVDARGAVYVNNWCGLYILDGEAE
jgi:hypothetical protein